ncbi:MAG: helix-turn-helix transcriptional regulator [Clostridia bacterium]|nr:helix-turn-helix transcriptional regulator [Clostridia bacterium]
MDNILFGEIIKNRREELNISQDELCEGILDRTALSRIENGKAECRKYVAEVLLERLNLPMEFYYASYSKKGIEQIKIKNQIKDAIRMKEYGKLSELLDIAEDVSSDNILFSQFILRCKAIYTSHVEKDKLKAREMLFNAMSLLHKDFSIEKTDKLLLTTEELYILNSIANSYSEENDQLTAIKIYQSLVDRIKSNKNNQDNEEMMRILIMLYYNLSRALGRADYFKECLEITEEALPLCERFGRPLQLAQLLMNKGYALCATFKKEEGTLILKDAIILNRRLGFNDNVEIIKRDSKKLFGINLDKV